jgi:hypothetical protein
MIDKVRKKYLGFFHRLQTFTDVVRLRSLSRLIRNGIDRDACMSVEVASKDIPGIRSASAAAIHAASPFGVPERGFMNRVGSVLKLKIGMQQAPLR